jgi:hypothetical protein
VLPAKERGERGYIAEKRVWRQWKIAKKGASNQGKCNSLILFALSTSVLTHAMHGFYIFQQPTHKINVSPVHKKKSKTKVQ